MRFELINTLPKACPLFVEDAYEFLKSKLGVKAWHWHVPIKGSELERFLIYGESRSIRDDFYDLRSRDNYDFQKVFDHALCFKCGNHGMSCGQFVLTMPYGDNITFYDEFNKYTKDYYAEKEQAINAYNRFGSRAYSSKRMVSQLRANHKFEATIVPNWFKVRKNGDFAAIIAMDGFIDAISELGGFPLVNADGSER